MESVSPHLPKDPKEVSQHFHVNLRITRNQKRPVFTHSRRFALHIYCVHAVEDYGKEISVDVSFYNIYGFGNIRTSLTTGNCKKVPSPKELPG